MENFRAPSEGNAAEELEMESVLEMRRELVNQFLHLFGAIKEAKPNTHTDGLYERRFKWATYVLAAVVLVNLIVSVF